MAEWNAPPCILNEVEVKELIDKIDVRQAMRGLFRSLAAGTAVQPAQQLVEFPNGGDFINYLGVMSDEQVYGIKTSPYIPTQGRPIVTAWTMLMSMRTGHPLLLADSSYLTTLRTAATTALAVDRLAPQASNRLAIVGSGPVALAHLRFVKDLREWKSISIYSLDIASMENGQREAIQALDPRIVLCEVQFNAVANADVVMLCTSSPKPVLAVDTLVKPALITSISTNAFRAHEIHPEELPQMDVYCDYRNTTPQAAGEMVLAVERNIWNQEEILGDLAELECGEAPLPKYDRHVFFRSIGLGLEDVAIALELHKQINGRLIKSSS